MISKLKTRKCKLRTCRAEFEPATDWQKFCSGRCRDRVKNQRNAEILRRAKKIVNGENVKASGNV